MWMSYVQPNLWFYCCMGSTAARGDVTLQEELYLDAFFASDVGA